MVLFQYTARDINGDMINGKRSAASAEDLAVQLQQESLIPVEIFIASKTSPLNEASENALFNFLFKAKVKKTALQMFCRQMHAVLKAGVPIGTAVSRLAETTRDNVLKKTLQQIMASLNQGHSLYIALGQFPSIFSTFFVNLVKVGESTGRLDTVFLHLSKYLELETDTTKKVKSALRYPTLVIIAILVALFIINIFVIPAFAGLFASFKAELPLPTKILIWTSTFLLNYWYIIIGILIILAGSFVYYIKTVAGELRWDKIKLKIPIIGWIIHRILLLRFARLYALVLRAGLTAVDGIDLVGASTGNAFVAYQIKEVSTLVERGNSISSSIAKTNLFPPLVVQMITIGEETGTIDDLLDDVADFYQNEVEYDLVRLSDAIEPIVLIIMAIMVFILALGVFLPMWELASKALH